MSLANKLLSIINESASEDTYKISEGKNSEYEGLTLPEYFQTIFESKVSYVNISLGESEDEDSLITHTVVNGIPFTFRFSVNEDKPMLSISTLNGESVLEKSITLSKKVLDENGDLNIEEKMAYMPTDKIYSVIDKLSEKATVVQNFAYLDKNGNVKSVSHNVNERMTSAEKTAARKRAEKKERLGIVSMPNDAKTVSDIITNLQQIGVNGVLNSIETQIRNAEGMADGVLVRNGKKIKISPDKKAEARKRIIRLEKLKQAVEADKKTLLQKFGADGKKGEKL